MIGLGKGKPTIKSQPPYEDPISVARLLGAEASSVASCNNISSDDDHAGAELKVALRCACPSAKQMENGVISLLTYMVTWNDTVTLIGEKFGVDVHSVLDANMLSWSSTIYPFTPILVPLKQEICTANPAGTKSLCP
ncbi:hypothetical protein GBA52_018389 [Prunus armeniaca]|nr:hypothetical protein GBA52_018389 [Prunus armeniaca]